MADDSATPQPTGAPPTTRQQPQAPPSSVKPADAAVKPLPPPRLPPSPERAAARLRFLDGLLVAVVLVFAFESALFPVRNSDFFFHAASGRLIAHGDFRPMTGVDPFAFTSTGYWANTNWLYDLIVYYFYAVTAVGGTILIVAKALMVAALAEVMLRTGRQPGRSLWVPACCVALAVLTLSPRVLLQPITVSFFFLGVTYWLLNLPKQRLALGSSASSGDGKARGRPADTAARRPFLAYWWIPPLCLLWANLDGWFFLGPITVALFLAGETVQAWLAPAERGRPRAATGELRTLFLVLLASVAACLVNPHHVHAFTLPSALGLSDAADALARDEQFQALFSSPFENYYFHPQIGLTVAGMAFYPLMLIGLVSFAAGQWMGRWSWERALVWTAFLALAAWRSGAIPFFAVVAGSIASLNFLDFAAARASAAPAVPGRTASIGGRVLTLLAGLLLLVVAWPGWLQAQQPPPWQWRRVGWTVEPDPALVRVMDRIHAWQRDSGMPHGVRWFNDSPAVLPYLAWYCPGELAGMDGLRLPLYDQTARDFKAVRDSLALKDGDAGKADPRWRKLLRSLDARFLICYEPTPLRPNSPLPTLLSYPDEWALLYVDGPASVFGWRDPADEKSAHAFTPYETPMDREAFGPQAVPAPPATEPPTHEWWAALWTPDAPKPPEADEAVVQWLRFKALQPISHDQNEKAWKGMWTDLKQGLAEDAAREYFGAALSPYPPFQFGFLQAESVARQLAQPEPPLPSMPPKEGEEVLLSRARKLFDYGPPAPLYLSIRAARRALTVRTDDPQPYLFLAQDYFLLMVQTREGDRGSVIANPPGGVPYPLLLRQVQIKTALRRCLDLDPNQSEARILAQEMYNRTGFRDVALKQMEEVLRIVQEGRANLGVDPAEVSKNVEAMRKQVNQQHDTYLLKTANKRVAEKVQTAVQMGLGQTALDELLKVDWNAFDDKDPNKIFLQQQELNLLLQTGQVDDVAKVLKDDEEKLRKELAFDPAVGLPAYEWLRIQAAAAKGDYADADHWLDEIEKRMQDDLAQLENTLTAQMVGNVVLRKASLLTAPVWYPVSFADDVRDATLLEQAEEAILDGQGRMADVEAVRGWLALEAGNIPQAREHTDKALKLPRSADELAVDKVLRLPATEELRFRGRGLADLCRDWLNAGK